MSRIPPPPPAWTGVAVGTLVAAVPGQAAAEGWQSDQ